MFSSEQMGSSQIAGANPGWRHWARLRPVVSRWNHLAQESDSEDHLAMHGRSRPRWSAHNCGDV